LPILFENAHNSRRNKERAQRKITTGNIKVEKDL